MYHLVDDTIVAVSSAPGHGPRGIVRLSGPDALEIVSSMLAPGDALTIADARGYTHHPIQMQLDEYCTVPAVLYIFRRPHSYTRQDSVELHTVGAPPLLEWIVERSLAAGARLAEPGEFTARAFLGGAMSLAQAEAVAATINARSDKQLRSARRMMRGQLGEQIVKWRDQLAELLALVVADIDFSEEPIDFISPEQLRAKLASLSLQIDRLIDCAQATERIQVLPQILLLGPPNAGKSTLMNRLSGIDRAIASAVSGTTRDLLSTPVTLDELGEIEAILLDAAGIDESADQVISAGRQRATEAAQSVDLCCVVLDMTHPVGESDLKRLLVPIKGQALIVGNKLDLIDEPAADRWRRQLQSLNTYPVYLVSAASGHGCAELKRTMADLICDDLAQGENAALSINGRQREALAQARAALGRCQALASNLTDTIDAAEIFALELREALDALGTITGQVTTEDLLGRVFSSFCIGK